MPVQIKFILYENFIKISHFWTVRSFPVQAVLTSYENFIKIGDFSADWSIPVQISVMWSSFYMKISSKLVIFELSALFRFKLS